MSTDINIIAPLKGDAGASAELNNCLAIGNEANAESLGSNGYSTAIGHKTRAAWSNEGNTAIGYKSAAVGYSTTAVGSQTKANGENSTVVGTGASAEYAGTAIGKGSAASGNSSISIGNGSAAGIEYDIVIGAGSKGSSNNYGSIVMGPVIDAGPRSGVLLMAGYSSNTERDFSNVYASVIGIANVMAGRPVANASYAVVIGCGDVNASSNYGVCIGFEAKTGNGTAANTGNVAIGSGAKAGADGVAAQCVAIGDNAEASEENTVSFGNSSRKPRIVNVGAPTADSDAATKAYVDASTSSAVTPVNIALTPASGVDATFSNIGAWSSGSLRAGCILGISNKTENDITISGNATFATLAEALEGSQVSRTFDMTTGELGPVLAVASNGTDLSLSQDVTIGANAAVVLQILEEVL